MKNGVTYKSKNVCLKISIHFAIQANITQI